MKIREKLQLMKEMEKRNEERRKKFVQDIKDRKKPSWTAKKPEK